MNRSGTKYQTDFPKALEGDHDKQPLSSVSLPSQQPAHYVGIVGGILKDRASKILKLATTVNTWDRSIVTQQDCRLRTHASKWSVPYVGRVELIQLRKLTQIKLEVLCLLLSETLNMNS